MAREPVTDSATLSAALDYARRGWRVFPCEHQGKHPLTDHGFQDATTDEAVIRDWWHHATAAVAAANIARRIDRT